MSTPYSPLVHLALDLVLDLWWFIENVSEETPDRTDRFFALRERVRTIQPPATPEVK